MYILDMLARKSPVALHIEYYACVEKADEGSHYRKK